MLNNHTNLIVTIERNGKKNILVMNSNDYLESVETRFQDLAIEHKALNLSGRWWKVVKVEFQKMN